MKHGIIGRKLGRSSSHRKALFRNLAKSLIDHEMIITTLAKAKEMRRFIEPLVTISKQDNLSRRRLVMGRLSNSQNTEMLTVKLFKEIGPRFSTRSGGYTRITKLGRRRGDSSEMAVLEFVDRNPEILKNKIAKKKQKKEAASQVESQATP